MRILNNPMGALAAIARPASAFKLSQHGESEQECTVDGGSGGTLTTESCRVQKKSGGGRCFIETTKCTLTCKDGRWEKDCKTTQSDSFPCCTDSRCPCADEAALG